MEWYSVLSVLLTVLPLLVAGSWVFRYLTKREESRTEAAVDALLVTVERRSESSPATDANGPSADGRPSVTDHRDAALVQMQANLEHRLDALERRQIIADDRNFALLRTYHSQGLAQSKISFWFSLALGVAGFGLIVWTVVAMMRSGDALNAQGRATIPLIAGTVTEAVATLFFVQSNNIRKVMTSFFDKLRLDRNLDESLRLINSVKDSALQGALQAVIAMHLVDATISPSVLPGFGQSTPAPSDFSNADVKQSGKAGPTVKRRSSNQVPESQAAGPHAKADSGRAVDDRQT